MVKKQLGLGERKKARSQKMKELRCLRTLHVGVPLATYTCTVTIIYECASVNVKVNFFTAVNIVKRENRFCNNIRLKFDDTRVTLNVVLSL